MRTVLNVISVAAVLLVTALALIISTRTLHVSQIVIAGISGVIALVGASSAYIGIQAGQHKAEEAAERKRSHTSKGPRADEGPRADNGTDHT